MEIVTFFINFVLHIDKHLLEISETFGFWTYFILFLIIFVETGLVVMPFLPGDSLLFAAGALAALGTMNIVWLSLLLVAAAILGDTVNYHLGHFVGERAFNGRIRFLKQEHLERAEAFFAKYGRKAIVLARFVPIMRTFVPFVAGASRMPYGHFILYNVAGGTAWVLIFLLGGFFFGALPVVQENFGLVIPSIILLSLLPVFYEMVNEYRHRRQLRRQTLAE